jgi:hypothetical protein
MIRRDRSGWPRALRCFVAAVAAAAGCLPQGEPPAGRQLVADRTSVLAGIVPSTSDGALRVLFLRPGPPPPPDNPNLGTSDLYVVSAASSGGAPSEHLLAASIPLAFPSLACSPNGQSTFMCFPSDARGRVFVTTSSDPSTGTSVLERIDPVTGERLVLPSSNYVLSPSRQRLLVFAPNPPGAGPVTSTMATLYEPDDSTTVIEVAGGAPFIDEDLYYATPQHELARIAPGGTSQILTTGITAFGPIPPTSVLFILERPTADPGIGTYSIFDPATGQETPSPIDASSLTGAFSLTASPGGRWLLHADPSRDFMSVDYTFFDRVTGAQDVLQLPGYFAANAQWRPRQDAELWIGSAETDEMTTWIKRPGQAAVSISGLPSYLTEATNLSIPSGFFTPDGATWFSQKPTSDITAPEIQVGSADDPAGPRFDLVPANQTQGLYWQLPDGRILMPTYKKAPARSDIYAFDAATGDARLLGEAGRVTAVGQTRMLATVHVVDNPGDLAVVELASGESTVLAPEFTLSAFVEPQGADLVAPGTHVAYQFQARFPSPFDGIWVATIP